MSAILNPRPIILMTTQTGATAGWWIPIAKDDSVGTEGKINILDVLNLSPSVDPTLYMLKADYADVAPGVVKDSALLQGQPGTYYLDRTNATGSQAISTITGLVAALAGAVQIANLNTVGNPPTIQSNGLLSPAVIPFPVPTIYVGAYDAVTNSPTIVDGTGSLGQTYLVSNAAGGGTVRNFGSGNQTFFTGNLIVYNGSIWQKIATSVSLGVTSITTATQAGATGAVNITSTANFTASTNKNFVRDISSLALLAAEAGSFPPSGTNAYVTHSELLATVINASVTNEWLTPEQFADGHITGTGTLQLLSSLTKPGGGSYSLPEAQAQWGSAVDLTWGLDSACWNRTWRTTELAGGNQCINTHSGKKYMMNKTVQMFTVSADSPIYKRADEIEVNGSCNLFYNATGAPLKMFQRMPASQTAVPGNSYGDYRFYFHDFSVEGSAATGSCPFDSDDTFCELGATYGTVFERVNFRHLSKGVSMYFALNAVFDKCLFNDCITYSLLLSDASEGWRNDGVPLWSGTSVAASGSNNSVVKDTKFRVAGGAFAGLIALGSDGIGNYDNIFEGASLPQHHYFWDGRASTVNKTSYTRNLHVEQDVLCSAICYKMTGSYCWHDLDGGFVQNISSGKSLVETRTGSSAGIIQVNMNGYGNNESNWKLRKSTVGSSTTGNSIWNFGGKAGVKLQDDTNLISANNWNTATIDDGIDNIIGVIPAVGAFGFQSINPFIKAY